jgi:hypothetical protein
MQPRHLGYVCAWGRPGGRLLSSPYGNGLLTDRRVAESEASATVERGSLPVAHETNQTRYSNNVIQRLIIPNIHGGLGVTRSAPVSKGRSSWASGLPSVSDVPGSNISQYACFLDLIFRELPQLLQVLRQYHKLHTTGSFQFTVHYHTATEHIVK